MQQDDWNTLFLGVIAGYFLVMTVALIWVAFVVRRGVREVSAVASDVRLKIDPVLARVREIADDVEGMSATARREVERLGSTAERVSNRVDDRCSATPVTSSPPTSAPTAASSRRARAKAPSGSGRSPISRCSSSAR